MIRAIDAKDTTATAAEECGASDDHEEHRQQPRAVFLYGAKGEACSHACWATACWGSYAPRRAVQLNKYSSGYEVRGGGTGI